MYEGSVLREMGPVILCSADGGRWLTCRVTELMVKHASERMNINRQLYIMGHDVVASKIPTNILRCIHVYARAYQLPSLLVV